MTTETTAAETTTEAATTETTAAATTETTSTTTSAAGETKTEAAAGASTTETKAGTSDQPAEAKTTTGAPEKYALVVPEGASAYVDDADLRHIETTAKAAGWTQAEAQAALDEYVQAQHAQNLRWFEETKADPTYGGEHLAETQRLANAVLDRFAPKGKPAGDGLRALLNRGAGNALPVVRFLADIGKSMAEDTPPHARSVSGGGKSIAEVLYDHPTSQSAQ